MKCEYCKGTGKYKEAIDKEAFEEMVEREMDKAYFVNRITAEKAVFKKVKYNIVLCPHCQGTGKTKG